MSDFNPCGNCQRHQKKIGELKDEIAELKQLVAPEAIEMHHFQLKEIGRLTKEAEQIAALEQDYKAAREIGEAYDPDGMAMKNREQAEQITEWKEKMFKSIEIQEKLCDDKHDLDAEIMRRNKTIAEQAEQIAGLEAEVDKANGCGCYLIEQQQKDLSRQAEQIRQLGDKLMFRIEDISRLKDDLTEKNKVIGGYYKAVQEHGRINHEQAEQITELEEMYVDAENRVTAQAEQITAYEEAIAENEMTTADQQGTLDGLEAENQRLKEYIDSAIFDLPECPENTLATLKQALKAAPPQGGDSDE